MDDILNEAFGLIDDLEGPPLSPSEMGITETAVAGGESNPRQDIESDIRQMVDGKSSLFGHGTNIEDPDEIINQGLFSKLPELESTTIPLIDNTKTPDEQAAQAADMISQWKHKNARAVAVVSIPNPDEGEMGGRQYFNSVFEEVPPEQRVKGMAYRIPSKYIRGYADVNKDVFIPNPNYNPEKLVVSVSPTVDFSLSRPQAEAPISVPTSSEANAVDDVW